MSWEFKKSKFKVGDRVHFPYGKKIGTIKEIGAQVMDNGAFLGFLYTITSYTLTDQQIKKCRKGSCCSKPLAP